MCLSFMCTIIVLIEHDKYDPVLGVHDSKPLTCFVNSMTSVYRGISYKL